MAAAVVAALAVWVLLIAYASSAGLYENQEDEAGAGEFALALGGLVLALGGIAGAAAGRTRAALALAGLGLVPLAVLALGDMALLASILTRPGSVAQSVRAQHS